jgi:hypothetical protein
MKFVVFDAFWSSDVSIQRNYNDTDDEQKFNLGSVSAASRVDWLQTVIYCGC